MFKPCIRVIMTAVDVSGFWVGTNFQHHRKLRLFSCSHQKACHGTPGSLSYLRAHVSCAYILSLKCSAVLMSYHETCRARTFCSTRQDCQNRFVCLLPVGCLLPYPVSTGCNLLSADRYGKV